MELSRKQYAAVLFLLTVILLMLGGCRSGRVDSYINFKQANPLPSAPPIDDTVQRPLLIALATVLSPQETITNYRQIADYVSFKTGRPAVLVQRKTYEEVNMLLSNGEVDLAFMSTGAFSSYRGMREIELLAMAEFGGTVLYNAEIIVHKDSHFSDLEDLQGKVFAFTDPLSYSGHMVIVEHLGQRKALPETFFKRYFYTYSHDKSLWAVANKVADGASVDSQILDYVSVNTPDLMAKIKVIARVGPAPTGPVAVRKNMPLEQKNQLRAVFLGMHDNKQVHEAMKKLIIDRFVPPQPELYEPLQKLYERTSLNL